MHRTVSIDMGDRHDVLWRMEVTSGGRRCTKDAVPRVGPCIMYKDDHDRIS